MKNFLYWPTSAAKTGKKSLVPSFNQGITKRCRLSWLTNSALVYEPKCGGMGGGGVAGSQPLSTVVHMEAK
jgi:hypothetical protein